MKFKADFHQLVFFSKIEHAVYMQIENKYSSMEVSAIYIYTHKNENLQKTRVSATSCVFEYYISNIKNQKRKKLRENWKTLHNLVLLVGFLIFHVLVRQLVGQKKSKKKVRVFSMCKIVIIFFLTFRLLSSFCFQDLQIVHKAPTSLPRCARCDKNKF